MNSINKRTPLLDAAVQLRRGRAKSRFSDKQVSAVLAMHDQGTPASELCRVHRISTSTFYKWKAKQDARTTKLRDVELSPLSCGNQLGRPSRISLNDIVQAAQKIGPERATIKNVAVLLGMSPTGLYHHVKTRDELLEIVAQFAFGEMVFHPCEVDNFSAQLLHNAKRFYEFYASSPWAMQTVISGYVMFTPKLLPLYEQLFTSGVQEGFGVLEIYDIWMSIIAAVLGAAAIEVAERTAMRDKATFLIKMKKALAAGGSDMPNLRALVDARSKRKPDHFNKVRVMIDSLAGRAGGRFSKCNG